LNGLAGLLVNAFGPVDIIQIWLRADDLAVEAIHRVEEAVTCRMGDQLAPLISDGAV
jgi:hypothetical protein